MSQCFRIPMLVLVLLILIIPNAAAYIGPGAGLTVIGTVIAVIFGVALAILGFIWYPVKRLIKIIKKKMKG